MNLRERVRVLVDSPAFFKVITALIVINAAILGLETYPQVMAVAGEPLHMVDHILLWVFTAELALRLFAYGPRFFRDPWNIFDVIVVAIAFLPATGAFSVLRAARVLRVLRLISGFPKLRRVIEGLIFAIPGIASIGAILTIIFYVFAVMATRLFGPEHPEWFGTLQGSMFSLFQIMTMEGWADMVRKMSETSAIATPFFIVYILIATFTVLNLFIAVIVDAMQRVYDDSEEQEIGEIHVLRDELRALNAKMDKLLEAKTETP